MGSRYLRFRLLIILLVLVGWPGEFLHAKSRTYEYNACAGGVLQGSTLMDLTNINAGHKDGGTWTVPAPLEISDIYSANPVITGLVFGQSYTITWAKNKAQVYTFNIEVPFQSVDFSLLNANSTEDDVFNAGASHLFSIDPPDGMNYVFFGREYPDGAAGSVQSGTSSTLNYTVPASGVNEVWGRITDANGCISETNRIAVSNDAIVINVEGGGSVCDPSVLNNEYLVVSPYDEVNYDYRWFRDGLDITPADPRRLLIDQYGDYIARVYDKGTPTIRASSSTVEVANRPLPDIIVGPTGEVALCPGASVIIDASLSASPDAGSLPLGYTWFRSGVETSTGTLLAPYEDDITVNTSGNYEFKIFEKNNPFCYKVSGPTSLIEPAAHIEAINDGVCAPASPTLLLEVIGAANDLWTLTLSDGSIHTIQDDDGDGFGSLVVTLTNQVSVLTDFWISSITSTLGCAITDFPGNATFNVVPTPSVYTVSLASGTGCEGQSNVISLSGSQADVFYQLLHNGVAVGTELQGTDNSLNFPAVTLAGTYRVVGRRESCEQLMTGSVVIAELPAIQAFTVSGDVCRGEELSLDDSETGVTYRLYRDNIYTGTSINGITGSSITFGGLDTPGLYEVEATRGTCPVRFSSVFNVQEYPLVRSLTTNNSSYCALTNPTGIVLTLSNAQAGVNYQLQQLAGASYIDFRPVVVGAAGVNLSWSNIPAGRYRVNAYTSGGCSTVMGNVLITVNPLPVVEIVGVADEYCADAPTINIRNASYDSGTYSIEASGQGTWWNDNGDGTAWMSPTATILNAGPGVRTITYTYTDLNGCTNFDTHDVTVNLNTLDNMYLRWKFDVSDAAEPWKTFPTTLCDNDITIQAFYQNGTLITDGSYSGMVGLTDGGNGTATLDVTAAGRGSHNIQFDFTDATTACSGSISEAIQIGRTLQFTTAISPVYCEADSEIKGWRVDPIGGTLIFYDINDELNEPAWTKQPMTGTDPFFAFQPSSVGIGEYVVIYEYDDAGCISSIRRDIEVVETIDPSFVTEDGSTSYCLSHAPVKLDITGDGGGSYSGPGVSSTGEYFYPHLANVGTHTITRTIVAGPCTESFDLQITVTPPIDIIGLGVEICEDMSPVNFEASNAGAPGTFAITSTLNGAGISPLESVDVTNGTAVFNPALVGPGFYDVTIEFTSTSSGVSCGVTRRVEVKSVHYVNFEDLDNIGVDDLTYCQFGDEVNFAAGSYLWDAVAADYVLDALLADGEYSFSGTDGLTDHGDGSATLDLTHVDVVPGTYDITFTYNNPNGCVSSRTRTITVRPAPQDIFTVERVGSRYYCSDDVTLGREIRLSGSETGVTYELLRNGLSLSPAVTRAGNGSSLNFGVQTLAGKYTVMATNNASGCESMMTGEPRIDITTLSSAVSVVDHVSCKSGNDGELTVARAGAAGNYVYQWEVEDPLIPGTWTPVSTSQNADLLFAGNYRVIITDNVSLCSITSSEIEIEEPAEALDITLTSMLPDACSGEGEGGLMIQITGGTTPYTINWEDALGNSLGDQLFVNDLEAGNYTVKVTDAELCTYTETFTVSNAPVLSLVEDISERVNVVCYGDDSGIIVVEADGGSSSIRYQFSIDNVNWVGPDVSGGKVCTFDNLVAGIYTLRVRDADYPACVYTMPGTVQITQLPQLTLSEVTTSHVNVSCRGAATGQLEVLATGGSGLFDFSIDNGISWQSSPVFSGLAAGAHYVWVRDRNNIGCEYRSLPAISISEPPALTLTTASKTNLTCFGDDNGSITVAGGGGSGNYLYAIKDAADVSSAWQASPTFIGLTEGDYRISVRDANDISCQLIDHITVVLTEPDEVTLAVTSSSDALCFGEATGSITVVATGGSGLFDFSIDNATWQTSASSAYTFAVTAGTYQIWVRDQAEPGCVATLTTPVDIDQPAQALSVDLTEQKNVLCKGASTGEIEVNAVGGTSPYDYVWYNVSSLGVESLTAATKGGFTNAVHSLDAGDYKVYVRDDNNCLSDRTFTITEPGTALVVSETSRTHVTAAGGNNGSILIQVTSDIGYGIQWTGVDNNNDPITGLPVNELHLQNLIAGLYTATVTDVNFCTVDIVIRINEPGDDLLLELKDKHHSNACDGTPNGSLEFYASGGTTPYTLTLTNNAGDVIPAAQDNGSVVIYDQLPGGYYNMVLEDDNGELYSIPDILIEEPPLLGLNFSKMQEVGCHGGNDGEIRFNASGGIPFTGDPSDPAVPNVDYYLFTLVPNNGPSRSYFVEAGAGLLPVSDLPADDYVLLVEDARGCQQSHPFSITQPDPIVVNHSKTDISCFGAGDGAITISVDGGRGAGVGYNYLWHKVDDATFSRTTKDVSGLESGTYYVEVAEMIFSNCPAVSSQIIIHEPSEINVMVNAFDVKTCHGDNSGRLEVSVNGGTAPYLVAYANNIGVGSNTSGNGPGFVFNNLVADDYIVTVTDDSGTGCSITAPVETIDEPADLVINTFDYSIDCDPLIVNSGILKFEISGGVEVAGETAYRVELRGDKGYFVGGNYNSATAVGPEEFNNLPADTYTFTVQDRNADESTACPLLTRTFTLSHIEVSPTITNATCLGVDDGTLSVSVTGGSGDYSYSWTKEDDASFTRNTNAISYLFAGVYHVEVTDNVRGCTVDERNIVVGNEYNLNISGTIRDVSCAGAKDGAVLDVAVTGASDPSAVAYSWSGPGIVPPVTTANLEDYGPGSYMLTVDDGFCSTSEVFVIRQPAPIAYNLTSAVEDCEPYARSITLENLTGGTGNPDNFDFYWNGPGSTTNTRNQSGLSSGGTYTVEVRDGNNCVSTQSIIIPSQININEFVGQLKCNGDNNGSIVLSITGGSGAYTFEWTSTNGGRALNATEVNSQHLTNLTAGRYTVTVTDANETVEGTSCAVTKVIDIVAPPKLVLSGDVTNLVCAGNGNGQIILDVVGGFGEYTFLWASGNGASLTPDAQNQYNLPGGIYSVTVSDDNDCFVSRSFTVTEPNPLYFWLDVEPSNCDGENSIVVKKSDNTEGGEGGSGTYSYIWSGPGVDVSSDTRQDDLPGGEYTLIMRDIGAGGQGCQLVKSVVLTKPLTVSHSVDNATCVGSNDGSITLTPLNGVPGYSYVWTTTDGSGLSPNQKDQTGLTPGTYSVVINDSNGASDGPCTVTINDIVVSAANTITVDGEVTQVRCHGETTGKIDLTVVGGSGTYNYSWTGPDAFTSTAANINNLPAGSYSVEVTDNGSPVCSVTKTFVVDQPAAALYLVNETIDRVECKGAATGKISVTIGGGSPGYSYAWTGVGSISNPTSSSITGLIAGEYELKVTDNSGCTEEFGPFPVTEPAMAVTISAPVVQNVTVNGGNNGSISVAVTGGEGSYTIEWSKFDADADDYDPLPDHDNDETPTGLTAGIYKVVVMDGNGCEAMVDNIVVHQPGEALTLKIDKAHSGPCYGASSGIIAVTMSGGVIPYKSIALYDGATLVKSETGVNSATFTGLPTGLYEVVGVDALDEEIRQYVTIIQPSAPLTLDLESKTDVVCRGATTGSITVEVNGGVPTATGFYQVALFGNGLSGSTYVRNDVTAGANVVFNNIPAGTFTVRVIDDSNVNEVAGDVNILTQAFGDDAFSMTTDCYLEETVVISQPEARLNISVEPGSQTICSGMKPNLLISTSDWDFSTADLTVTLNTGEVLTVDAPTFVYAANAPVNPVTIYTITSVVVGTCSKGIGTGSATVTMNALPTASLSGTNRICAGESTELEVYLTGTAPWSIVLEDDNGNTIVESNILVSPKKIVVQPVVTTEYKLVSVSDKNCVGSVSGTPTISVDPLASAELLMSNAAPICQGASKEIRLYIDPNTNGPWQITYKTEQLVEGAFTNASTSGIYVVATDLIEDALDGRFYYPLSVSPSVTSRYTLVSLTSTINSNNCVGTIIGLPMVVSVNTPPAAPGVITGAASVCQGAPETYSIETIPGADYYVWTLPNGSTVHSNHTITINFEDDATDGRLSVVGVNACGSGVRGYLDITMLPLPDASGKKIYGPENICEGSQDESFHVDVIDNANTYKWTVPAGWESGLQGDGTRYILLDVPANIDNFSGFIYVTAENDCGDAVETLEFLIRVRPNPEAFAGADMPGVCGETVTLNATPVTNAEWSGKWVSSPIQGSSDEITNVTSPTVTVTGLSRGDNVFRWVVSDSYGCSTYSDVTVRNNKLAVDASAVTSNVCDGSTTLRGTPLDPSLNVTGQWTAVRPVGSTASFDDASSPNAVVSDMPVGENRFRWTLNQNGCPSPADVVIMNNQPAEAVINGPAIVSTCGDPVTLEAEAPGVDWGTGSWSVISGYAHIVWPNRATTVVKDMNFGDTELQWTVTKGHCQNTARVIIRNNKVWVDAGPEQDICSASTILEGSPVPIGATGSWHVIPSGSASFADGNSPTTTVTNLARGVTELEWRLTNNGCESSDEVTINNNMATVAKVGSQEEICGDTYTLTGNPHATEGEVGYWSVVSGSGHFDDARKPNADVSGMAFGENVFRWTINNNDKCSSSADLRVTNLKTFVDAGKDTVICQSPVVLRANPAPNGMTGTWTVVAGEGRGTLVVEDPSQPHIAVASIDPGANRLRWTIDNQGCYSSDDIVVVNSRPNVKVGSSYRVISRTETNLEAEPPGDGQTGVWMLISGGAKIRNPSDPKTEVTELRRGENVFRWVVTNGNCSDYAEVVIVNGDVVDANAGRDDVICGSSARLDANEPEGALGSWTRVKGTAVFANRFDPKTQVTNLAPGENILRWTITYGSSGSSTSSSDEVVIYNNQPATAQTMDDDVKCADNLIIRANPPGLVGSEPMGTPFWAIVSGGGEIVDPNAPETSVNDIAKGENVLVYTITKVHEGANKVCSSSDTLRVINGLPTTPVAGEDRTICSDEYRLSPNVPEHGVGRWRSGSVGGATFDGNRVYNLAPGENELIYEIATEWCTLESRILLTNNKPSDSFAGRGRDWCQPNFTMEAHEPQYGIGTWEKVSGGGVIAPEDLNNPVAEVTGLTSGSNRFRWVVDNNGCPSVSEVEIRYNFIAADAGDDFEICEDFTFLNGSNPMEGTGTWGVKGGSGSAIFEDVNDPLTRVSGLDRGPNVLTWTVSNVNCSDVSEVTIYNNKPTIPDAGDDQSGLCEAETILQGNTPAAGVGRWTVISGSATFNSETYTEAELDPNARVSGLSFGPNTLRWTISTEGQNAGYEGCSLSDEVVLTYNKVEAFAGNDAAACADEMVLSARNPSPGTGMWSVPGGQGAAVFEDPTSPNTRVYNLGRGQNTLRWTVWHNGCSTYDEVVIDNQLPSRPYAGNEQPLCTDETVLDATPPEGGSTGSWRVVTGSAVFEDETDPKTAVSGLAKGDNIFIWTTERIEGCVLEDEVLVQNHEPSDPYAGADYEEVCANTFTLKATAPEYGSGIWSFEAGGGNLSNPNDPEALITALNPGRNLLRWTVSQGQCSKWAEVEIINNTPTKSNAGPDIEDCKDTQTLDANVPVHFERAYWERISGYGELDDINNPKSVVRNLAFGANEFQWVIENGSCRSTDRVVIFNQIPDKAFAGSDQLDVCDTYTVLNGNDPVTGVGKWSVLKGGGEFDDPHQYNTIVRNLGFGENIFLWEVTYGTCSTRDEMVVVSHKTEAYAGEDQVVYKPEVLLNANNAGALDAQWFVEGNSTAVLNDERFFNTSVDNLSPGINSFRWEINVNGCISSDRVSVDYRPVPDAGFIVDVEEGCYPLRVQFTNYSVGGSQYLWRFGDGSTSADRNPVHVFERPGTFTVQLVSPGPDGQDGLYEKEIRVFDHPVADFAVNPTIVYIPGEKARFYDLSTDAVSWWWDFGDGVLSSERNPSHEYQEEGVYDVALTVGNVEGCLDTLIVEQAITAEPQGFVVFPNAFKPRPGGASGPGVDPSSEYVVVFKPAFSDVDEFTLEIFNRWGQRIFKTNDINTGWDGMYEGQMAPQAVYVYLATGKYVNGREFRKTGSVLLVR